jgi:hypothetical protein
MTNKAILAAAVVCMSLGLAGLPASGQGNQDAVITINGGHTTVLMRGTPEKFRAAAPSSKLVTIYSDLGKGQNVYNGNAGYGIFGNDIGMPWPQSAACGFRPKADHIVTEVRVGASHISGPNFLIVSLNENTNDRPGKALHTWKFSNLPTFGSCCTLQVGKFAAGVKVKKRKLYWIVLRPFPQHQDTYDVWDNDFNNLQGAFSNNLGSGWTQESYQQLGAFGVFGK